MSKESLIDYIKSLDVDHFKVSREVTMTEIYETFDIRSGAIYPPMPFTKIKHYNKERLEINIKSC